MKLSPRYTEKQWNSAFDGREAWNTAINIVKDCIKGRWLYAADRHDARGSRERLWRF
jgi:hypothetical protein